MPLRELREAEAGEHAELDHIAGDFFVVDVVDRRHEGVGPPIAPDDLRHRRRIAPADHEIANGAKSAADGLPHEMTSTGSAVPTCHAQRTWTSPFRSPE